MVKGLLGGMTDYNHQSFPDILNDLDEERKRTISFRDGIQKNITKLTENSYWTNTTPFEFKSIIVYALRYFNTSISEFEDKFIKDEAPSFLLLLSNLINYRFKFWLRNFFIICFCSFNPYFFSI